MSLANNMHHCKRPRKAFSPSSLTAVRNTYPRGGRLLPLSTRSFENTEVKRHLVVVIICQTSPVKILEVQFDYGVETVMAKHNIRHATKADFEGVMSIGDVYHGNDYLPHFYHSFIEDPNARSYVYFVGDEVVAFSSDVLVDDGHTLLLRAGRVRDDYRDQGIYGQLLKHVYKEYSQMEGVDFEAMTTNNIIYEAKKGRLPQQFTEEWWKTLENVMCNSSNIDVPTVLASSTKVLTEEDIVSIFSREGTREDLFPCGRLVVDWCSYKPLASNMKYILKSGGLALATKDSAEKTLLLSISTFFPCQLGFNYLVDVFGTDNLHLKDHVITHLKHMKSLTDGQVLFQVATDRNEAKTKEILMNLKLQPYDFPDNTIHYLGRKFQKR